MDITADHLVEALRVKGLRITAARRAVCEVVAQRHGQHLTAATILETARTLEGGPLDQSTVYRTLDALEESGLLIHSHVGHGPAVYHVAAEATHQHIICKECGAAAEIPAESLDGWILTLRDVTGFEVDPTHVSVTGLCEKCAERVAQRAQPAK